jgi:acetyl-CoA decarbonylase/synthase complex subunit gamma
MMMALTGLDIYKLLPKTNCKDCGFATCLAFAMALAQKRISLEKCPHVSPQAKEALEGASQPPIKLVTIGTGDQHLEVGNETVMYRHEQRFHHPTGIGFLIDDDLDDKGLEERLAKIKGLAFERVGQTIRPDLICLKNSSKDKDRFARIAGEVVSKTDLNIALCADSASAVKGALDISKERRPLLVCLETKNSDEFALLAKENKVPLAVTCETLEDAAQATDRLKKAGVEEIVINLKPRNISRAIQDFTYLRRAALKKNIRALGYPIMVATEEKESAFELAEAVSYILKYAGIVIVKSVEPGFILPLLVARQDIYTDPQKPVQVEPRLYEIGKVSRDSPVLITTNFSITYFTVAGEVESSKVPSYIVCCDSEGMSVLTAWAAEKFTAESIAGAIKKYNVEGVVSHRNVVIPGYVSVLSGKLEEESGWKVSVGPREASGIPNYLRSLK